MTRMRSCYVLRGRMPRRSALLVLLLALAGVGPVATASADTVASTTTVGGSVPSTLGLIVTSPGSLGPFIPGVADTYTTTMTATVISTAGGTALTAVDSGGTATPGHWSTRPTRRRCSIYRRHSRRAQGVVVVPLQVFRRCQVHR
jgi:hypothetical protein